MVEGGEEGRKERGREEEGGRTVEGRFFKLKNS